MKVGEYVRTNNGLIAKYIGHNNEFKWHLFDGKIQFYYEYYRNDIDDDDWEDFKKEEVLKVSSNLIDLIEENDFVKIEYFSNRYENRVTRWFEVDYALNGDFCFENGYCRLNILNGKWSRQDELLTPIIKSIVTKEQFESMEYKIC